MKEIMKELDRLLYRLFRCRNTETSSYRDWSRDGKLAERKSRCERWLHLGGDHR